MQRRNTGARQRADAGGDGGTGRCGGGIGKDPASRSDLYKQPDQVDGVYQERGHGRYGSAEQHRVGAEAR